MANQKNSASSSTQIIEPMNRAVRRSHINQLKKLIEDLEASIQDAKSKEFGRQEHWQPICENRKHMEQTLVEARAKLYRLQMEEL